jgi:GT2 family glycosyltransferase
MTSNGSVRPSRSPVEDPRVTVVVVSRNRREELLRSLGHHRAPVVLVDNGSTDGSAEAVRRAYPDVEVVELRDNIGAAARTIGVERARTPMVAFADDDSWWTPGSLRAAADGLDGDPRVGLVTVEVRVGEEQETDPFTGVLAASPLPSRARALPGPRVLGFMGCAAMVRRSAFLEAGGFDHVVRFPGEEERLVWDLTAAGWDLVYLDGPVVRHYPSPRRDGASDRRRGIARARVLTATMRLPWRQVAARVVTELRAGPGARRGVLDAAKDLGAALPRRAVLPRHVLADLDTLAAAPAAQGATAAGRQ